MKEVQFKKIDAFSSSGSSGNPAAAIYLNRMDELMDVEKLRIAKELKGFVSEVGFVCPGGDSDLELCYFSSEREVAFCGHATIAIIYDWIASHPLLHNQPTLTLKTRHDRLSVRNHYRPDNCIYISAPPARFSESIVSAVDVARSLSVEPDALSNAYPIQRIHVGLETWIIPMSGLSAILNTVPDFQTLKTFCIQTGADIVLLYSRETSQADCRFRTRVFAPTFGYLEDPATGSGNSAFGYYLLATSQWNGEPIRLEQNAFRDTPNIVRIYADTASDQEPRIWFGGSARTVIDGHYHLPAQD